MRGLSGSTRKWWLCPLTRIAAQSDLSPHGGERVVCANINVLAARTAPEFLPVTTRRKARVGWGKGTHRAPCHGCIAEPIRSRGLRFTSFRQAHPTNHDNNKRKREAERRKTRRPTSAPRQTSLRSRRKPSAGCSARSAKRARLSASRHGSNPQSVSPLGATPGQASWDADA
jgi:hypothetical protein